MNSQPLQRYRAALLSLPAPGNGCHTSLLGAANLGVLAGLDDGQIFADLAGCISAGTRRIAPREIEDAIRRARHDYVASGAGRSTPPRGPVAAAHPTFDGAAAVAALVRAGGANLDPINDILRQSAGNRVQADWRPEYDHIRLLETLYDPDEFVYIGPPYGKGPQFVRRVADWLPFLREAVARGSAGMEMLGQEFPHIIPNPLTGQPALTKDGRQTWRGDANVSSFRFLVGEFDALPRPQQLALWRGLGLPVCALIDSGNRSYHAWVRVDGVTSAAQWEQEIEIGLFRGILEPLGVDSACKNESRLSRLPGVPRFKNGKTGGTWQQLYYLNREGGTL